ncbi:uncharacterized protein C8Q71DRAFT_287183 [Rhodofomes roseus]|uniref:Uncharacterized protein n=1 Tax=Rhodofomes roseus TaxID=34475 RepID=A0ABQ8K565_9APHY|nr:uncharacterized protein C8Q71DRAFT_287183 [Rhodofomes roseus]KAH9831846.1 hypothetical protein C8Q71DRAFT_287183 [Rhodofomes roseus]
MTTTSVIPPTATPSTLVSLLPYLIGLVVSILSVILSLYVRRWLLSRKESSQPSDLPLITEGNSAANMADNLPGIRRMMLWLRSVASPQRKRSPTVSEKPCAAERDGEKSAEVDLEGSLAEYEVRATASPLLKGILTPSHLSSPAVLKSEEYRGAQLDALRDTAADRSTPRRDGAATDGRCAAPAGSIAELDPQNLWITGRSPLAVFLPSVRVF